MERGSSAFHSLYGCGISSFNSSPAGGGTGLGGVNHHSNQNSSPESRQSSSIGTPSVSSVAAAMLFQPLTVTSSSQGRTLSLNHQQLHSSDSAAGYRLSQLGLQPSSSSSAAGNEQLARLEREMLAVEYKNASSAIDFQPPYFPPPCDPATASASSGMTMTSSGQFHLMGYSYGGGGSGVGSGHAYGHHSNVPHQNHQQVIPQHHQVQMAPSAPPPPINESLSYWTPLISSSYSMNGTPSYGETSPQHVGKEMPTYHTLQEVLHVYYAVYIKCLKTELFTLCYRVD